MHLAAGPPPRQAPNARDTCLQDKRPTYEEWQAERKKLEAERHQHELKMAALAEEEERRARESLQAAIWGLLGGHAGLRRPWAMPWRGQGREEQLFLLSGRLVREQRKDVWTVAAAPGVALLSGEGWMPGVLRRGRGGAGRGGPLLRPWEQRWGPVRAAPDAPGARRGRHILLPPPSAAPTPAVLRTRRGVPPAAGR